MNDVMTRADVNMIDISGKIVTELIYDHNLNNEKFYRMEIQVIRTSGSCDYIPVIIADYLIDPSIQVEGKYVQIHGQVRTYNKLHGQKGHMLIAVYALRMQFSSQRPTDRKYDTNDVVIVGHLCKDPLYRVTPMGREITDILIAVNRARFKSDYLPCLCWGKNAKDIAYCGVGDCIRAKGRIQSRQYKKEWDSGMVEMRVAREISLSYIECVNET